jgi:alanine dehydrogenase
LTVKVGTIKETKNEEYRVGLTPAGVRDLAETGHTVLVQRGAGEGSGFPDEGYAAAGATLLDSPADVAATSDLLVKVKEPLPPEYPFFRQDLTLFAYLHLAPNPELTDRILASGMTAIAYETVQQPDGSMPLLTPMSQIAGRMAAEMGAHLLKRPGPGRGKLLGGVAGVAPCRAVILGSGNVATAACRVLMGLEARITVMSRDLSRLAYLEQHFGGRIATRVSTPANLEEELQGADLLITAILVPGGKAPRVITRQMVRSMGPGAVVIDVSIDQGGTTETSHPTTHADPTYMEEGVIHYCVPNMPGAVPRTSTEALTSATLPYVLHLANEGHSALRQDPALAQGVNIMRGKIICQPLAQAVGRPFTPLEEILQTPSV